MRFDLSSIASYKSQVRESTLINSSIHPINFKIQNKIEENFARKAVVIFDLVKFFEHSESKFRLQRTSKSFMVIPPLFASF